LGGRFGRNTHLTERDEKTVVLFLMSLYDRYGKIPGDYLYVSVSAHSPKVVLMLADAFYTTAPLTI